MTDQSSGIYIINKKYDIVSYNQTAIDLYPQLKKGEKCYKCLMGLEEPCPRCPVVNEIKGPKIYFDPIRHIHETVDAVPLFDHTGKECFALVFSTVGEREEYAKKLPNTEEELNLLYEQEYYDKLTGGFSLKGFIRETGKILEHSAESEKFAILYFNIRNFKAINDMFGFEGGDDLLCQAFYEIKHSGDHVLAVARIAGDHFIVLIRREERTLDFIVNNTIQKYTFKGKTVRIHTHCGVYLIEDKTLPVSGMIDRARLAKEHITDEYLKPYAVFDEEMHRDYVDQAKVLADYENAIRKKEFKVYYQPIIEVATGKIASAEALVRWNHPEKGMVSPEMFIPVLEKNGHITKLDYYMAEQIYEKMYERKREEKRIVPVSVNLSWMDLYDETMRDFLKEKVQQKTIPNGYIRVEATETALNSMEELCSEFLELLRKSGSKILLDDFGSGYSSFSMIQKYDFDILKIDIGFVREIEKSLKTQKIICAIIAMCHQMNISVVAEGVETKAEYEFLQVHECDYIQGYYVSKPMMEEEFYEFLDCQKDNGNQNFYFERFVEKKNGNIKVPMSARK